ncbi:MAG TPA: hypothetical protein VGN60_02885 [Devosia sp.]|jgi:hypothetical protein|nr:hypothetical protein [Devosia sp.]
MTDLVVARLCTPAKSIAHSDIFEAASMVNLACLATERIADLAAAGLDVEGHLADLMAHLKEAYRKLT